MIVKLALGGLEAQFDANERERSIVLHCLGLQVQITLYSTNCLGQVMASTVDHRPLFGLAALHCSGLYGGQGRLE